MDLCTDKHREYALILKLRLGAGESVDINATSPAVDSATPSKDGMECVFRTEDAWSGHHPNGHTSETRSERREERWRTSLAE